MGVRLPPSAPEAKFNAKSGTGKDRHLDRCLRFHCLPALSSAQAGPRHDLRFCTLSQTLDLVKLLALFIGLAKLLFVENVFRGAPATGKPHETFKLDTEGKGLPFQPRTLHFLAHKKLIETGVKTHKGLRCRLITREAVLNFTSKYVAAGTVARELCSIRAECI